jgi:large repetitive protein
MVRQRIVLAVLAAIVLVAVAPEANGGGGTPISSCGEVVTTNAFLTQSIYCPGSSGIVVGAAGITIDLKGFTLRGDRSSNTWGVDNSSGFDGVTIKNGVLRDFTAGVIAFGADRLTLSNMVASGNASTGISVGGASISIRSASAVGNPQVGIEVEGTSAKIQSSTASGNQIGIYILGDSATIRSSAAEGNAGSGILVEGASAKIQSSVASGNDLDGIFVLGEGASLIRNRTDGNGYQLDTSDFQRDGIQVVWATSPPVGTNIAHGNDDPFECIPAFLC